VHPNPNSPSSKIDLTLDEDSLPNYSDSPADVVDMILKNFDQGLQALQEVNHLEQKLLPALFKSNAKSFFKVPVKPNGMPEEVDRSNKQLLPDPNPWIWHAYARLRNKISDCVEPLDKYLATLDKYRAEYALDPVEYIKKMIDEENPAEAEALKKDVIFQARKLTVSTTRFPTPLCFPCSLLTVTPSAKCFLRSTLRLRRPRSTSLPNRPSA
jgi:hypothetical protein